MADFIRWSWDLRWSLMERYWPLYLIALVVILVAAAYNVFKETR